MTVSPGSLVIASTVQLWLNTSIMRRSVEKFHLCVNRTLSGFTQATGSFDVSGVRLHIGHKETEFLDA